MTPKLERHLTTCTRANIQLLRPARTSTCTDLRGVSLGVKPLPALSLSSTSRQCLIQGLKGAANSHNRLRFQVDWGTSRLGHRLRKEVIAKPAAELSDYGKQVDPPSLLSRLDQPPTTCIPTHPTMSKPRRLTLASLTTPSRYRPLEGT